MDLITAERRTALILICLLFLSGTCIISAAAGKKEDANVPPGEYEKQFEKLSQRTSDLAALVDPKFDKLLNTAFLNDKQKPVVGAKLRSMEREIENIISTLQQEFAMSFAGAASSDGKSSAAKTKQKAAAKLRRTSHDLEKRIGEELKKKGLVP